MRTFCGFIRQGRKAIELAQREFSTRILFEDGHAISLPYVSHLEHNLRKRPRVHMIEQFAEAISVKCEVFFFLVGRLPDDVQVVDASDDQGIDGLKPALKKLAGRSLSQGRAPLKVTVKGAPRNRPDWIIIGGTRDGGAWDLMNAARTGHPMFRTVHASSAHGILARLMSLASRNQEFVNEALDLGLFGECFVGRNRVPAASPEYPLLELRPGQLDTYMFDGRGGAVDLSDRKDRTIDDFDASRIA